MGGACSSSRQNPAKKSTVARKPKAAAAAAGPRQLTDDERLEHSTLADGAPASLTRAEIDLVQSTFAMVAPISEEVSNEFYNSLFELEPSVRPLFKADIKLQGRKLLSMLSQVVMGLDDLSAIVGPTQELGRRHVAYGAKPRHFDSVGHALLATLEARLGSEYTPAVASAWTRTYSLLAKVMIDAMKAV